MAGWSELPPDLLRLIADRLDTYIDKVQFAFVCTSWRSVLPTITKVQPWLIVLPRIYTNKKYERFVSLHDNRVHYLEVPEVHGKKFRGSSLGWLVSIERNSPRILLFNPITSVEITLPPRYKFPDVKYCAKKFCTEYALECSRGTTRTELLDAVHVHVHLLQKVVLSSSPTSTKGNSMVAVAIYGSHYKLAYCKLGDKKWTAISNVRMGYQDAIFHQGKLYALTSRNDLEVFNLSADYPEKIRTVKAPITKEFSGHSYLVNTSIGLLQVHRHWEHVKSGTGDNHACYTSHFKLYMYDSSSRSWCKCKNIGENVMFLGLNTSISITSSHLPPSKFYKGNRIYFTDDNLKEQKVGVRGRVDIGFYDLNSRLTKICQFNDNDSWQMHWPTPIWYIRNPEDFIKE